jgi:molecular chaperone DnaJ
MSKTCYYVILGAEKDEDTKSIKSKYRKLAMQYHPDRNPDNEEAKAKFQQVAEAWGVLEDGKKRAAYDQHGHDWEDVLANGGASGGFRRHAEPEKTMKDIFEDELGKAGTDKTAKPKTDLRSRMGNKKKADPFAKFRVGG